MELGFCGDCQTGLREKRVAIPSSHRKNSYKGTSLRSAFINLKEYMAKTEVLPVRLDSELKTVFLKVAEMEDRPASQIVRELIREYVKSHAQLDLIETKRRKK